MFILELLLALLAAFIFYRILKRVFRLWLMWAHPALTIPGFPWFDRWQFPVLALVAQVQGLQDIADFHVSDFYKPSTYKARQFNAGAIKYKFSIRFLWCGVNLAFSCKYERYFRERDIGDSVANVGFSRMEVYTFIETRGDLCLSHTGRGSVTFLGCGNDSEARWFRMYLKIFNCVNSIVANHSAQWVIGKSARDVCAL